MTQHLGVIAREPRPTVLNRGRYFLIILDQFCRAYFFRYKTKFLDLKDEVWLRYDNFINSIKTNFLLIFKIFKIFHKI
jgi:hypothetical protein